MERRLAPRSALLPILALVLAGCSGSAPAPQNEAEVPNVADPAITAALQQAIMVDPQLGRQANGQAIRPPAQPATGGVPDDAVATNNGRVDSAGLRHAPPPSAPGGGCPRCAAARRSVTLGGLAAKQPDPRTRDCAAGLRYSADWAARLPADLPLYPRARVVEAAGSTAGGCRLRVVSFSAPEPLQTMLDWYYTRALAAGYDAEHQAEGGEHVLGGTRARDGGAYVLFLRARRDGGTDVDLVANNGS